MNRSVLFLLAALCYLITVGITYYEGGSLLIVMLQLVAAILMIAGAMKFRSKG